MQLLAPASAKPGMPADVSHRLRPLCAHLAGITAHHPAGGDDDDAVAVPQSLGLTAGQLAEYEREGVTILRGVLRSHELSELREEVGRILDRAPTSNGAVVDRLGGSCLGEPAWWQFAPALRGEMNHAAQSELRQAARKAAWHKTGPGEAEWSVKVSNWMTFSEPGVRLYGHPQLLAAAQAINGADFVPFSESLVVKHAGHGAALAWHQDGKVHWADGSEAEHGFNFMVNLYDCNTANALWVLPRSHRRGKIEVAELVQPDSTVALAGCPPPVPVLCKAGDVAIVNRNAVHGSYANASPTPRHTFIFGFHKRSAVEGVHEVGSIETRRKIIPLAISCRAAHYPNERPFMPLAAGGKLEWGGLEAHSELLKTKGLGL